MSNNMSTKVEVKHRIVIAKLSHIKNCLWICTQNCLKIVSGYAPRGLIELLSVWLDGIIFFLN